MTLMEKYDIRRKIGQGSFGTVHIAVHKATRKTFVVKEIKTSKLNERETVDAHKEVQLLSQLIHPNIVEYVESFIDNQIGSFYIVMENCEGGDLYSLINKQRGRLLSECVILGYFAQLCRALQYIHDRKILHRDIKSQNIFVAGLQRDLIKLGDFGIARIMDGTHDYARTCIGTPYYLSPEVWENRPYNAKSDLWAMGCVLYEMTTLKHAFEAGCMKNLMFKIIRGSYPPISPKYSYDIRNLIAALLRKRPEERPSLSSIMRKGFILRAENLAVPREKNKREHLQPRSHISNDESAGFHDKHQRKRSKSANRLRPKIIPRHLNAVEKVFQVPQNRVCVNDVQCTPKEREEKTCFEKNKRRAHQHRSNNKREFLQNLEKQNEIAAALQNESHPRNGVAMWIDFSTPKKAAINSDTFTIESNPATKSNFSSIHDGAEIPLLTSSERILNALRKISCFSQSSVQVTEYVFDEVPGPSPEGYVFSWKDTLDVQPLDVDPVEAESSSHDLKTFAVPEDNANELRKVLSLPNIYITSDSGEQYAEGKEYFLDVIEKEFDCNVHSYLEQQRVFLESKIGLDKLMKVYNLIASLEELENEQVDYRDLTSILGDGNQLLIDDIIQLVVADNFF